jgi:hypothetical protein
VAVDVDLLRGGGVVVALRRVVVLCGISRSDSTSPPANVLATRKMPALAVMAAYSAAQVKK